MVNPIAQAPDFVDLCELFGYYAEEHVVHTEDGYLLGIHRLAWKQGEEDQPVNSGPASLQKKVVYLHHGLMMNSEVWVCLTEKERCLPFHLVERGFDVWLGNNRGNKYSKKATHCSPASTTFWNFSIDQFAFHDIPDTISYILTATGRESLSYVGFSQGTAQAFATLSIHPQLNHQVDVFIALAPAMSPPGLANGIVSSLVKTSPEVLYLIFGRRSILSSATMWQAILYPPIFARFIDIGLRFLFGWHSRNITPHQKLAAYPHLYSFTSTKSVVHWFQIIRQGSFQMFDDEIQGPFGSSEGRRYYKVPKFPTRNIKSPVVLLYGGSDSLVDIKVMLKELPNHTIAQEVPHYEHLDFLWAGDVDRCVFPNVVDALDFHARPLDYEKRAKDPAVRVTRYSSTGTPQPPSYSEDEGSLHVAKRASTTVDGTLNSDAPNSPASFYTPFQRRLSGSESTSSPSPSTAPTPTTLDRFPPGYRPRSDSIDSRTSSSEARIGAGGISVGTSKAVGNVVNRETSGQAQLDGRDRNLSKKGKNR